jgi:DNA invertase Pin-like site-specific DNA recombinase
MAAARFDCIGQVGIKHPLDPRAATMTKAYSYLRFSTPEQMHGDSFRRQSTLAAEYAAKHGLDLDTELTFNDLGVSAFRGKNAEAGRLADFLDAVENEVVPKGSYLLVESLDRVSRAAPRKAVRILERICEAGVNVVTLSDGRVYNEENLDSDGGMSLIMSVLIFVRANEESAMKSKRLKASWEGRRQAARESGRPATGRTPHWLKLNKETREFELVEEKVAVVRRVFAMAANGYGLHRIAQTLTEEGVPTLDPRGRFWRHTSVRHLLCSETVIGTYKPTVIEHTPEGKRYRRVGDPIPGYYPQIISEELFRQVQETRASPDGPVETARRRGRGSTRNFFSGLTICSRCGGTMTHLTKTGSRDRATYRYFVCTNARYGQGCKYSAIRYENVEESFLRDVERILAMRPTATGETEAELDALQGPISALEERIGRLVDGYERVPDVALLDKLSELRAELTVLKERERELTGVLVNTAGPIVLRRIEALQHALAADPRDAKRINLCLRALCASITLNPDTGTATIGWKGGGESQFIFQLPEEAHLEAKREAQRAQLKVYSERLKEQARLRGGG